MDSRPAREVLVVTKKYPESGKLAKEYIAKRLAAEHRPRFVAAGYWLEHKYKSARAKKAFEKDKEEIYDIWAAKSLSIEDAPFYVKKLPPADIARIQKNASRIESRRKPVTVFATRLAEKELEPLFEASSGMRLAGYATEHEVDVAFAAIHAECQWLGRATEVLWKQARLSANRGLPFHVGPVILLGPPGLGKSTLARALGAHFSVPTVEVDAGATAGVFDLQGTDQRWGSSAPGRIMMSLLQHKIGNPLVVVDEINAGSSSTASSRGVQPGLFKVLMGMLEPMTAARWNCPYFQVPVDLRHVSWVMTTNSIEGVEQALLDRCRVIELDGLTLQQLTAYARAESMRRMGDELIGELICDQVSERARRGETMSLRHVSRMIERAEAVLAEPVRH